uniref:Uncharacterized protein n=1 Tax=Anguilla anguilla TaxID=7936 RepID=A0A0E9X4C1_ANGAN
MLHGAGAQSMAWRCGTLDVACDYWYFQDHRQAVHSVKHVMHLLTGQCYTEYTISGCGLVLLVIFQPTMRSY